ncbi:hypothetical protein Hamer_G012086 [Homarus americanus]|uniref:Uncharacterized protein n=1 Tax=Homarus americanus TaxID=6706 RepID=A0A8J5JCJ3_HOMAM|nr:hypothetical protein Hamer_G012086 [Homarus americanus]
MVVTQLQSKLGQVQAELQQVTQRYEAQLRSSLAERRYHQQQNSDGESTDGDDASSGASSEVALLSGGGGGGVTRGLRPSTSRYELATRVQNLKDEFTDLLTEIRRRKSVSDSGGTVGVAIQTEFEEDDGEIRRPRKRALSTTSTWSSNSGREVSSCMARPLTTPTQPGAPPILPNRDHAKPLNPPRALLVTDIT